MSQSASSNRLPLSKLTLSVAVLGMMLGLVGCEKKPEATNETEAAATETPATAENQPSVDPTNSDQVVTIYSSRNDLMFCKRRQFVFVTNTMSYYFF